MVANYHIPRIPTKDNPAIIKHESLDFLKQNVFDAIGGKVYLDKCHSSLDLVGFGWIKKDWALRIRSADLIGLQRQTTNQSVLTISIKEK